MSRYRRNKDASHSVIVDAFRRAGCSVVNLESAKAGLPDLAVGVAGRTHLVELKNPEGKGVDKRSTRPSAAQVEFAASWRGGPVHLVRTPVEAWELANLLRLTAATATRAAIALKNAPQSSGNGPPDDKPEPPRPVGALTARIRAQQAGLTREDAEAAALKWLKERSGGAR